MLYKRLSQIIDGKDILAQPIRQNGRLLVPADTVLSANLISRLDRIGYGGLYVVSEEEEATFFTYDEEVEILGYLDILAKSKLDDPYEKNFVRAVTKLEEVIKTNVLKNVWNSNVFAHTYKIRGKLDYDFYHALSVCALSITVGRELDIPFADIQKIAVAAILHDVGKNAVKLRKNADMNAHPKIMADILKYRDIGIRVTMSILQHHEFLDGSGFYGYEGDKICQGAQIISVCDTYDNHANPRHNSFIQGEQEALEYLLGNCGTKFNEDIVKALSHCVRPFPVGSNVLLSNKVAGKVVQNHKEYPLRPVIDANGVIYDLSSGYYDITVVKIIE